jgi:hypothetical protein
MVYAAVDLIFNALISSPVKGLRMGDNYHGHRGFIGRIGRLNIIKIVSMKPVTLKIVLAPHRDFGHRRVNFTNDQLRLL